MGMRNTRLAPIGPPTDSMIRSDNLRKEFSVHTYPAIDCTDEKFKSGTNR
jgi:hypothetical protein